MVDAIQVLQAALVWQESFCTFFVLILGLDIVNGVRRLHLQGDGLAGQGLDENLHTTTQTEHQVKGGLLLNVVIGQSATILKLLAGKDETLLVGRDT